MQSIYSTSPLFMPTFGLFCRVPVTHSLHRTECCKSIGQSEGDTSFADGCVAKRQYTSHCLAMCRLKTSTNYQHPPICRPLAFSSWQFFSRSITLHSHLLEMDSIFKIRIKFSARGKPASPAFLVSLEPNCIVPQMTLIHTVILRPAISYYPNQNAGILGFSSIFLLFTIFPVRSYSQKTFNKVD